MNLFKDQMKSWGSGGMFDPTGITGKVLPKGIDSFVEEGPVGNASGFKRAAGTKMGSVLSGRAIMQGSPQEQDMETGRTFDVLGSPATAGTKQQTTARIAAILYGMYMGGAALGAGSGGTTSASSAPTASPAGGFGATQLSGTVGGGTAAGGSAAGGAGGWQQYARMAQPPQQQQKPYQPSMQMVEDDSEAQVLARLLRKA